MRTSSEGRPRVQSTAIACAIVLAGAVACGAKAASLTCGEGTHVSGTMCVAGEGDAAAGKTDSGPLGRVDARSRDAVSGTDAPHHREASIPDVAAPGAAKDASREAASVPESCGDINGCIAGPGDAMPSGPVDLGTFDDAEGDHFANPLEVSGTQSEWLTLRFISGDFLDLPLALNSRPEALFDLYVYEVLQPGDGGMLPPPSIPSTCPALVVSGTASADAGGATVLIPTTGQLYIHVVAQAHAKCASGLPWTLSND